MQDYHVVAYTSQLGRVLHPDFVAERPNLSQDTHVTVTSLNDGTLNITIWWMYDELSKAQEAAHTKQIIKEVQLKLGLLQS
jgi:hypothetical protein